MKTACLATVLALLLISGCSSTPADQTTKDLADAPALTQEQKDAMSQEEKVEAYNASMSEDRDKLVCRREQVTGSHFRKTICRTQGQIEEERRAAQDALRQSRGIGQASAE